MNRTHEVRGSNPLSSTSIPERTVIWGALIAFIGVVWLYLPCLGYNFVWDDFGFIVRSPWLKQPWYANFKHAFTEPMHQVPYTSSHYRPLQTISYWADFQLWKLNTFGYHLHNILLHAINGGLFLAFLLALKKHPIAAGLATFIYCIHPLHTASVAYVAGRPDLLVAAFLLLTLLCIVKERIGLACFFLGLGLLSKEMALTILPLAWILHRSSGASGRKSWIFAIPVAVYGLVRWATQVVPPKWDVHTDTYTAILWNLPHIISNQISTMLVPHTSKFYYPLLIHSGSPPILWWRNLSICLGFLLTCCWTARRFPSTRIPIACIWIGSLAALPIYSQVLITPFSEHWTFISWIGVSWLIAIGLDHLVRHHVGRLLRLVGIILYLLLSVTMIHHARQSQLIWKDSATLYKYLIDRFPNSSKFRSAYASELNFEQDRTAASMEEALISIHLNPKSPFGWAHVGLASIQQGNYEQAQWVAQTLVQLDPNWPEAYWIFARVHFNKGEDEEGEQQLKKALEIRPDFIGGWTDLGWLYARQEDWPKAAEAWEEALQLDPERADLHLRIAAVYNKIGDNVQAEAHKARAEQLIERVRHQFGVKQLRPTSDQ